MKKKVFELLRLAAASPAHRRHGRQKDSFPECDLTGRRVMVNRSSLCLHRRNYDFTRSFDSYSIANKALVAFWQEFHFNSAACLKLCSTDSVSSPQYLTQDSLKPIPKALETR